MADMDRARFEALLDAYGASPRRWPDAERAAAEAFAAANPAAFDLIAEAARIDDLIEMAPFPAPSAALSRAVAAAPARPAAAARRPPMWWLGAGLGAALAGAAAGALTVGVMAPGIGAELSIDQVSGASTAFGSLEEGANP